MDSEMQDASTGTPGFGEMFCFTYAWRRRWRRGRPYRVIHLHWPRAGITACEEARRTLQAEQDRDRDG